MTKIIEQQDTENIKIYSGGYFFFIEQINDAIEIDRKGAAELIKALQEFLDENN